MNKTLVAMEESAGTVIRRCSVNKLKKIVQIPELEPLFNEFC